MSLFLTRTTQTPEKEEALATPQSVAVQPADLSACSTHHHALKTDSQIHRLLTGMGLHIPSVLNLTNCVMGISILTMPYILDQV